jgi:hypothetical protein
MPDPFDPHGESRRRALFAALVASQDHGLAVRASRAFVASRFDVTAADVARVEREGLDAQWPPLWPGGPVTRARRAAATRCPSPPARSAPRYSR